MAKSFNTNVAEAWISTDIKSASEVKEVKEPESKKESVKKEPEEQKETEKKETEKKEARKAKSETTQINIVSAAKKTKAASFLLTESNHSKLVSLAKKNGISVNSCLNQILEQVL